MGNHIDAKRYNIFRDPSYFENMSDGSKGTFAYQGGVMEKEEAAVFEKSDLFQQSLLVRKYDELAKVPNVKIKPIRKCLFQILL